MAGKARTLCACASVCPGAAGGSTRKCPWGQHSQCSWGHPKGQMWLEAADPDCAMPSDPGCFQPLTPGRDGLWARGLGKYQGYGAWGLMHF